MAWGTITVGGIDLLETLTLDQSGSQVALTGQQSTPPGTRDDVMAAHRNIVALEGQLVPVTFTDKAERNGYYQVTSARSTLMDWHDGRVTTVSWSLTLDFIGGGADVEFESRVPTIQRQTAFTSVPTSFWHSPPTGALSYYTGSDLPSVTTQRNSLEGPVAVYQHIPVGFAPRWTCSSLDYMRGACRVLVDQRRVLGTATPKDAVWEINNGVMRVFQTAAGFAVSVYQDGVGWVSDTAFALTVASFAISETPQFTILRNDPEQVTARLSYPVAPGRQTLDLSLRRGSRFVSCFVARQGAAPMGVRTLDPYTATQTTGGLIQSAPDANGNKFVLGSTMTNTVDTSQAWMQFDDTLRYDFFAGHEVGASPQTGDAFSDLMSQYLGTNGDRTRVVKR